jgi:hypothetical protein
MGHAIPRRHPAVVLRSRFNTVRALLAIALVAVVGLTVAVVILANDSDEGASTSAADPIESINYGDSLVVNPSTGYPSADIQPELPSSRYEGGPVSRYEAEGKYFIVPSTGSRSRDGGSPEATRSPASEAKHEAATAAAIGQSSGALELRGSRASEWGTSQHRSANP